MKLVIEERLYRQVKENNNSKGKYYLDPNFLNRILKENNFLNIPIHASPKPIEIKNNNLPFIEIIFEKEPEPLFDFETMTFCDTFEYNNNHLEKKGITIPEFFKDLDDMWSRME
jgi:hypothetical protein